MRSLATSTPVVSKSKNMIGLEMFSFMSLMLNLIGAIASIDTVVSIGPIDSIDTIVYIGAYRGYRLPSEIGFNLVVKHHWHKQHKQVFVLFLLSRSDDACTAWVGKLEHDVLASNAVEHVDEEWAIEANAH